jgi:hypothetical protein
MTMALRKTTALRKRMHQDLQLAGLTERTQEAYLRAVRQLADHYHAPPDRLSEQQVRHYFLHLKNDNPPWFRPGPHSRFRKHFGIQLVDETRWRRRRGPVSCKRWVSVPRPILLGGYGTPPAYATDSRRGR